MVVPLGLRLVPLTGPSAIRLRGMARILQPPGALAAIASFFLPRGTLAGFLALGWLVVCGIASVAGLAELLEARSLRPPHLLAAAALGFLSVGAAWLFASRAGITLGFSREIVELTAVHFHYAGFAATLMSALALKALRDRSPRVRLLSATSGLLVIFGTPLTAAGIATSNPVLTMVGPILLATGLLTNAALTAFVIAPGLPAPSARWMLTISSAAVVIPMLLGVDYAAARVLPLPALDLQTMALVHGDLNAVLYALVGLAGWTLA